MQQHPAFAFRRNSIVRRLLVFLAGICILGLAWGVAGARAESSPSPADEVVLRIGWTQEPDNLNPFVGWSMTNPEVWAINYDVLFGRGVQNESILALAAEFPTKENGGISPDGRVWTIHLRPDARWSDGEPLTASDVAFTYNYVVKNDLTGGQASTTIGVTGAREIDPTTVEITCAEPKADFERIACPILPKHIWENVSPEAAGSTFLNPPPIVGSGPFYTVAFKKGSYIEMARNPHYWGKKPAIDRIYFQTYQNADTMVADLVSGALDGVWGIPVAQFKRLSTQEGIEAVGYNFYNWDYLNLNCSTSPDSTGNPALRDARFRNALNYAIDRERLCQVAYNGLADPATTILPPNTWFDPDYHWEPPAEQAYTFDLAKANDLLDQAGYARGPDGLRRHDGKVISLRIWGMTDFPQGQIEVKLIAGWLKELGLKPTVSMLDRGTLFDHVFNFKGSTYAPDFDMYIDDWGGYSDPGATLMAETTDQIGATNEPCWSNATYDKLFREQAAELDPLKRRDIIWQMQQVMYEETPWLVLVYPQYLEAYNTSRWTGWTRLFDGHGPALMTTGNIDSYLNLTPVKAAPATSGSAGTTVAIVVAAVVVAGAAAWLLLRRRRSRTEEV